MVITNKIFRLIITIIIFSKYLNRKILNDNLELKSNEKKFLDRIVTSVAN